MVMCLVLSPTVGQVVGFSGDSLAGMGTVVTMVMVLGEEGWMQRADIGKNGTVPPNPKFMFSRRPLTR